MLRYASQRHASGLKVNDEQNVVRRKTSPGQHFNSEKVGTREHRDVRSNEVFPGRGLPAFGRRRNAVPTKNVADRLVRNVVSDVGQRSRDAVVTPAGVLASESNNCGLDLWTDSWPTGIRPMLGAVELRGNESAIPAQDGVRLGNTGHLGEGLASHSLSDLGQGSALRIRQTKARGQACAEDAVFSRKLLVL